VTVTGFDVSLFLHITAVVIGLGSTFVEGLTFPVAMRLDPRHLPYKHRLQLAIHRFLTLPALVVVLATGFYQVAELDADLGQFWLSGALGIVVVLAGLIGVYFIPADRRLEAIVKRDIAASSTGEVSLSAEYQRRVRVEATLGGFASLLVLAAVYLMVTKPGL
jgi:uncharacterized membrane protein